MYLLQNRECRI